MTNGPFVVAGMHKLTTLDYPGLVGALVFTQGCNFHCPYCHNSHLLAPARGASGMDLPALFAFLKKRAGLLDGLVISGGEPTLQPGLRAFCRAVRALGYKIKLDTNGSRPESLRKLLEDGLLDYVALDYKALPERYYPALCPEPDIEGKFRESLALLAASGIEHELRSTCVSPFVEADMAPALAPWPGNAPWLLQRANLDAPMRGKGLRALTGDEMRALADAAQALGIAATLRP